MINKCKLSPCYLEKPPIAASPPKIIASLSKPSSGLHALTGGQTSKYGQATCLITGFSADYVLADKGYDSDAFIAQITSQGSQAVIPLRRNRKEQRDYDEGLYRERNLVERCFLKFKRYRRIATRYERLARNYLSMLCLVSSIIWLD